MKSKSIIIGCGGSGIKTILRLNAMIAGNEQCVEDMAEDLIYLPVDTDLSDLENFEKTIKQQMSGVTPPVIQPIRLSGQANQFSTLEGIVRKFMINPMEREGLSEEEKAGYERLKKYWWYSPEGRPFRALRTRSLSEGAGQCGPVSFLASWANLPDLEKFLQKVCYESQLRRKSNASWNIYVIAGTAGGTGRGCWSNIAFKVYQCLQKILGEHVNFPEGIFFDASCFSSLDDARPADAIRKKLNSLTAYSEISAWLRLSLKDGYKFSMPTLSKPTADETSDVLHVNPGSPLAQSPIRTAYIVAKENANGVALNNPKEYYEMAAAALYSLIVEGSVASDVNNRPEQLSSFASCTFEVDSNKLYLYLKNEVHRVFMENMRATAKENPMLKQEAQQLVSGPPKKEGKNDVDLDDYSFFSKTKFIVEDNPNDLLTDGKRRFGCEPVENSKEAPKLSLLEELSQIMATRSIGIGPSVLDDEAESKNRFSPTNSLLEELMDKENDLEAVQNAANSGLNLGDIDVDALIAEWCKGVVDKYKKELINTKAETEESLEKVKDINSLLEHFIVKSFSPKHPAGMKPSLGRCLEVANALKNHFETSKGILTTNTGLKLKVGEEECNDLEKVQDEFSKLLEADYNRQTFIEKIKGIHFSSSEIGPLADHYDQCIKYAIYFKLQTPLAKLFDSAIAKIQGIISALEQLAKVLGYVEKKFKDKLTKEFKTNEIKDVYKQLFVPTSDDDIKAAIQKADSSKNEYLRVLKPIFSESQVREFVSDEKNMSIQSLDKIQSLLNTAINNSVEGKYKSFEAAVDELLDSMVSVVSDNITLNRKQFSEQFSFENVLRNNIEKWNDLLAHRGDDGDLLDRFDRFLGMKTGDYDKDTTGKKRMRFKTVARRIVTDMLQTSKPWLKSSDGLDTSDSVLLLPFKLDESGGDSTEAVLSYSEFKTVLGNSVKLVHAGKTTTLPNDRIVVFVGFQITDNSNPFSHVESFNYWSEPDVRAQMLHIEDINASAFFQATGEEQSYPTGYTSPIFLTNEHLNASKRWAPWLQMKDSKSDNSSEK